MNASPVGIQSTDLTPWAGLFPLDTATPITCVHLGIEYCGEVVRATRWSPHLGGAPSDGSHFRIVLLQNRPKLGFSTSLHANTAVCIPAANAGHQVQRIIGEITAAKQAAYLTRRDVDAAAINSALRERQNNLQGELIAQESARFSRGDICVLGENGPEASDVYSGSDPADWMENLAEWLLGRSYPSLPLETADLNNPICEDDIAGIFAAIFKQPGADPEPLTSFGPALGLSRVNSAETYQPSECRVFPIIREFVGDGPINFSDLHLHLAHELGLTAQLASLFTVLFIHNEIPEYQLQLGQESDLSLLDGSPLLATRLTSDLIPQLGWNNGFAVNVVTIGPASSPNFSDARHHLSLLCPEIATCSEHEYESVFSRSIQSASEMLITVRRIMDCLNSDGCDPESTDATANLQTALERLGRVTKGDYAEVYAAIRITYPLLTSLADDLETARNLALLGDDVADIILARRYVSSAKVPEAKYPNLAVDQETLLMALSPSQLTQSKSRAWSAISRNAAAFKIRYTEAYRQHHQEFHDQLPQFQATLADARKKSTALGLLNTIVEIGSPLGVGLVEQLAAQEMGPSPCPHQGNELDLSNTPFCPECQISLGQNIMAAELARLAPQVEMALGGKTQELSRRLVEKTLAGHTNERWSESLQILQASELSSLANTLDNDLVTFIKQVLD